jgi:hypothetical protein
VVTKVKVPRGYEFIDFEIIPYLLEQTEKDQIINLF